MVWLVSRSFDQNEVLEHSCDRMFVTNLSSVSEVQYVAVELKVAQNQVRAVHGYAMIGIQCIVQDGVDQLSLFELGFPLACVHLGKVRS